MKPNVDTERPGWTDRVAVVATSFRRVGLGRLGTYVLSPEDTAAQAALREALGADELIYLATCNRVECYVAMPHALRDEDAAELLGRARAFFAARGASAEVEGPGEALFVRVGQGAVEHLLTVTSGLDSLVLGETEISGQAKRALERCAAVGLAGAALGRLFDRAAACSRRVKNETALGRTPASAAQVAVHKIRKYFGNDGPGVTVLVGAGEMTRKVAQALQGKPGERIFVNRTRDKAEELARKFGGRAQSLAEFLAEPPAWVDVVFAATAATEVVVPAEALAPALAARQAAGARLPLIVCDLGLPRDVDPALDGQPGVFVVDMLTIEALSAENQRALEGEAHKARAVVAEEVARLVREDRFRRIADESAQAMLGARLAHLSDDDRDAILRFATGLASRMARNPS
ncbi:MAG: glutamyl-tRNA reductase [Planctomycetota bacterium]|nr:glutamyl-tRNA reductase [Planctomycetota bacterium]